MNVEAASAAARAVLGNAVELALLRASGGAVFRAPGHGIVRVGAPAELPAYRAAAWLADAGAPLVRLLRAPVEVDGLLVVLLADLPDSGARDLAAYAALGRALAALHAAGAPLADELSLPRFSPGAQLETWLAPTQVPPALRAAIAARVASLAGALDDGGPRTILHTDAHAGNMRLAADGSAQLVDLEGLASGPALYDLTPVEVTERRFSGDGSRWRALVEAYGASPDDPRLRRLCQLREALAVGFAARAEPAVAAARLANANAGDDAIWTPI